MLGGHSPVSTLLSTSPTPFISVSEKDKDVSDTSASRSLVEAFDDTSSGGSDSDIERLGRIKKTAGSILAPTSTLASSLAARRARVLGANVATVDASLPPIVAGKGCRLFAEEEEEQEEEEREEEPKDAAVVVEGANDDAGDDGKKTSKLLTPYLDAQNNVAHLGHSHPAVSRAVSRAFETLNTNSRYLHRDLVSHAERLVGLLRAEVDEPPPAAAASSRSSSSSSLSSSSFSRSGVEDPVVYYVPSGTEANDLALRIARAFHEEFAEQEEKKKRSEGGEKEEPRRHPSHHHHRHHYLALEGAYHGHAGEPARVSSYVHFGGAVGTPCPEDVSLLRLPDAVRDVRGGNGPSSSSAVEEDPAPAVRAAAERARSDASASSTSSTSLTAFIFESFPSCAGQVLLPRGWLRRAVAAAREDAAARGGAPPIIVADEVQTGLGRLGPLESGSFWAFQHFGVPNPDVVTIGKPAANGFPFGAVVVSRRVAAAFARRHPPFFSTFGGCTAAASAALATLESLMAEKLPERAAAVGAGLLADLKEMAASLGGAAGEAVLSKKLVVDVRGVGLMLGVEVAFGESSGFAAAPRVAGFVASHCRTHSKVLVSCDGAGDRAKSVIKVKPPMCFGAAEARELVAALRAGFEAVPAELLVLPEKQEEEG